MLFSSIGALLALAVGAVAQTPIPTAVHNSVLTVVASALPKESVSYVLTSSSAFASEMASSFAADNTPAWYQALPNDVKTLLPALYPVVASPTPTSSSSSSFAVYNSVGTVSAIPTGANSTIVSDIHMPTLTSTSARPSHPMASANAAAYPAAALGAGVGAALGFIGMLVL